ncbi:MAG: aminotransferase class V-fold PLP-dependent enzyme [Candidatus Sumerlaeia bacterium]|nr:aminotransferase class V-fold PLP-dependent enzyme [Candidatus Sumerlaeia bacterium]
MNDWAPEQFPSRRNAVYLNHAGVSPLTAAARDSLVEYAREASEYGYAAYPGWTARGRRCRVLAAQLLNAASPDDVAFVRGTTHGLQLLATSIRWRPGDVVVVEGATFPANWYGWKSAGRFGAEVWTWPERAYRYDLSELEARLRRGGVRLVAVASANYATGWRQDLAAIGSLCRRHGALLCVDAIQTLGAFPLDVRAIGADFLCAGGHKWLLSPEGSGLLYVAPAAIGELDDALVAWRGRERFTDYEDHALPPRRDARRFEEGALNVDGILGFGASLELFLDRGIDRIEATIQGHVDALREALIQLGFHVVSPERREERCGIVAAMRGGADMGRMAEALAREGVVCVARRGFLRLAPHGYQTDAEISCAIDALRRVSAAW